MKASAYTFNPVMSATALQTTAVTAGTTSNDGFQSHVSNPRQSWACNSCHISFDNGQTQREHMKSPWHVYNLKRRIASLPPISLVTFNKQVQPESEPVDRTFKKEIVEDPEQDTASPRQCLFCQQKFFDDTEDLEYTLEHMFNIHGLFIPDHTMIIDMESFLGYLATQVRIWHECLFCGTTRNSTQAIQSHMTDSDHCKLNLEKEPELLEFWEDRSDGTDDTLDKGLRLRGYGTELSLSPAVSRMAHQRRAKAARARGRHLILRDDPGPSTSSQQPKQHSCQLSRRDEMGIQNVGAQQRHALVLAVKRSQKAEGIASRASEWSYARKANKQKNDQAHGPLSWAKGGLHNLLPR